jgi:hypothetical protein
MIGDDMIQEVVADLTRNEDDFKAVGRCIASWQGVEHLATVDKCCRSPFKSCRHFVILSIRMTLLEKHIISTYQVRSGL